MNHPLLAAILLGGLTALIHLLAGGQDVTAPLLAAPLETAPKFTLYAVWHMATLSLLASVAAWIYCLYQPAGAVLGIFLGVLWCGFGLVFLAVSAAFPEYDLLWQLPQWLLLLSCGLLAVWGLKRQNRGKNA